MSPLVLAVVLNEDGKIDQCVAEISSIIAAEKARVRRWNFVTPLLLRLQLHRQLASLACKPNFWNLQPAEFVSFSQHLLDSNALSVSWVCIWFLEHFCCTRLYGGSDFALSCLLFYHKLATQRSFSVGSTSSSRFWYGLWQVTIHTTASQISKKQLRCLHANCSCQKLAWIAVVC